MLIGATAVVGATKPSPSLPATTVTASFSNQPVASVLLDLGRRFGVTISLEPGLDGRVTAELHKATLSEALDAVLTPLGLHFSQSGAIFVISSVSSRAAAPVASATPSSQTAVVQLSNVPAAQAAGFLAHLYPRIDADGASCFDLRKIQSPFQFMFHFVPEPILPG